MSSHKPKLIGNVLWNFLGRSWGIVLALIYVPYLVHGLGTEAYGIYATLWVVLSYFQFLDGGFSRALEKYGAESLGAGDAKPLVGAFATAFWVQAIVGVAATSLLWMLTPLVISWLKISPGFQPDAIQALRLAGVCLGLNLASGAPTGAIRALQRFRFLNAVGALTQPLLAGASVGAVFLGFGLRGVMWAWVVKSAAEFFVLTWYSVRLVGGGIQLRFDRPALKKLFRFGGFLTLSGIMNPILTNIEKLMMGAMLPIAAVTAYMIPYRLLEQIRIVPESVSNGLFPYLNALEGRREQASLYHVNRRATELLAWALVPIFSLVWIAGDELLALWIGRELAVSASSLMNILAAGFFINMLAWNSVAVIQARGRPEWHVVLYVSETILYVPFAYWLIRRLGAVGAAWAWFARVAVDAVLQWTLAGRLTKDVRDILPPLHWRAAALAAVVVIAGLYLRRQWVSGPECLVLGAIIASLLVGLGWFMVLDASERDHLPRRWFWREIIGA